MSRSTRLKGWVAKVLRTAQNTFHNISQLDSFGLCILRFLDHWRPPAYLIAEPNQEAADQIRPENIREQDMPSQWWSMMKQLVSGISNPGRQNVACVNWNKAFQCLSRVSQMCQVFAPFQVWTLFEGMAHPFGQGWNLGPWARIWSRFGPFDHWNWPSCFFRSTAGQLQRLQLGRVPKCDLSKIETICESDIR